MATRPEFLPQFASLDVDLPGTGSDNKLRPPIEIRETGYDFLQKPPAEEFNWLLNNFSEWIEYLDDLTRDQGITEVASQSQAELGAANNVLMTPLRVLQSIQFNAIPSGVVQHTAASAAPTGWLFCNGAAVSRTTYARLFSAIGTTFGAGDGSTTFNLPDLRDEFIRGANPGTRNVGATENDQLGSHNHTGNTNSAGTHTHDLGDIGQSGDSDGYDSDGVSLRGTSLSTASAGAHTHSFTTNSTGGSETRPQNVALLPIIKI